MNTPSRHPIIQSVFDYYGECGRLAAFYELHTRLLVAKTPAIKHLMYERLESIDAPFLKEFESRMSDEEKSIFSKSKKIRDKILHADFKGLIDKVREISPGAVTDSVENKHGLNKTGRSNNKKGCRNFRMVFASSSKWSTLGGQKYSRTSK